MKTEIKLRDPLDLKVHPRLKKLPEWAKDDERFYALQDDIRDRGIDQPIIVLENDNLIVDGRHRWRAAKALQLKQVATVECDECEIYGIMVNSLLQRRHYTKSAQAYMAYPLIGDRLEESKKRQFANLKQGKSPESPLSGLSGNTAEELAAKMNISRALFFYAAEIHKVFAERQELKLQFEEKIIEDGAGLGAIKAAIGAILEQEKAGKHGGGRPEAVDRQLVLFKDVVDKEISRWQYWGNFDEHERREHFRYISAKAAKLEPEECKGLAAYHKRLAKEFEKAAKGNE